MLPARFSRWLIWGINIGISSLVVACSPVNNYYSSPTTLNSHYTDEQPALSGNGRLLAFVSNRDGRNQILLYDLQQKRFVDLPGLNKSNAIAQNPSLSQTGRYLVYLSSSQGRPEVELYDRATQRTQILTLGYQGWVRHPSISPDGRYIAFESGNHGQWDVEVLDRGPYIELDISDGSPSRWQ